MLRGDSAYAGLIFEGAGITDTHTQMVVNIGINVFCFLCAVGGACSIERLGRKAMLCRCPREIVTSDLI